MAATGEPEGTDDLLSRVRREWPELTWTGVDVPEQGMDHEVVVLRGVDAHDGGDDSADLVVRAPRTPAYRDQAPVEAAVLNLLASGPVTVRLPEPVLTSGDGTLTAQRFITGEPLTADLWRGLSAESRDSVTGQLAGLMSLLHGADVASSPLRDVEPWWTPAGVLNTESPRALPAKAALVRRRAGNVLAPVLSTEDMVVVNEILDSLNDLLVSPAPQRLIHSDLYDSHLLWDGAAQSLGVIDFSDMNLGDPAVDYAHLFGVDPSLPGRVATLAGDTADTGNAVDSLLQRAWTYARWDAVFVLIDHYRTGHTAADLAWELFAQAKESSAPPL
ncbi:MAG: aminoglycoside phosphotransferase family protein [Mycobacteriaceae bacterium]|uniref:aminoglycoside phosphotransferase family protein n=1 Tax=Corynebacterium sp. TaxID=1720 RepID=UPI003F9E7FAE